MRAKKPDPVLARARLKRAALMQAGRCETGAVLLMGMMQAIGRLICGPTYQTVQLPTVRERSTTAARLRHMGASGQNR